ncbi:MAG TPA: DnaJ domain-containing protein [Methyloceanibacter sp.]|nr:DnaJ domain-containing protein [Methyloceanibacter sp.]
MAYFLVGCALLIVVLLAGRFLVKADPQNLAAGLRKAGGVAALALAGFLILRGAVVIAIPLAVLGFGMLRKGAVFGGPFGSSSRTPGQKSRIKTDRLEMDLDHDSGHMDGQCLTGRFAGRALSSLSDREALELLAELEQEGAAEASVMEAYLDWRLPGWRDSGQSEEAEAQARQRRTRSGGMSAEEAYAVLGVGPGASEDDIRQAHRKLMMKLHPDQGGSTYLAARINEAKEVLLGRR